MKWVFYALLALNIWYFATQIRALRVEPVALAPARPQSNDINRLLTLKELQAGELKERSVPTKPGAGASVSRGNATGEPSAIADEEGDQSPDSGLQTGGSAGPGLESRTPVPLPEGVCLSFGPLGDDVPVAQIRGWLSARAGYTELRERERRELSRYWVYFPPFPSRAQAKQRVSSMRASGIDDIFIIPRGDMSNAVSLGVYSRRKSLQRRLEELRRNGYEPSVTPRYKTERATWLDGVFPKNSGLDLNAFNQAFAGVEVSDAQCTPRALGRLPKRAVAAVSDDEKPARQAAIGRQNADSPVSNNGVAETSNGYARAPAVPSSSVVSTVLSTGKNDARYLERVVSPHTQIYNAPETHRPYIHSSPNEPGKTEENPSDSAATLKRVAEPVSPSNQ